MCMYLKSNQRFLSTHANKMNEFIGTGHKGKQKQLNTIHVFIIFKAEYRTINLHHIHNYEQTICRQIYGVHDLTTQTQNLCYMTTLQLHQSPQKIISIKVFQSSYLCVKKKSTAHPSNGQ